MSPQILHTTLDLEKHESSVSSLSILSDGRVVSGGDDGKLKVWSSELKLLEEVTTNSGGILSLATGSGNIFVITSDQKLRACQLSNIQTFSIIHINSLAPLTLFFENDNEVLWIGDNEGRVTGVKAGIEMCKFELTEEIWDLRVTSNPVTVYTARDRDVAIAEIVKGELRSNAVVRGTIEGRYPVLPFDDLICCLDRTGKVIQVHENNAKTKFKNIRGIPAGQMILNAFCRCGERSLCAGGYDGDVSWWDISTGSKLGSVSVGTCINALAQGPAGVYAALANGKIGLIQFKSQETTIN